MQPGAFADDMNVVFDPVEVPFTSGYYPGWRDDRRRDLHLRLGSGNYH
jgi:hypothetical protein